MLALQLIPVALSPLKLHKHLGLMPRVRSTHLNSIGQGQVPVLPGPVRLVFWPKAPFNEHAVILMHSISSAFGFQSPETTADDLNRTKVQDSPLDTVY